MCMRLFWVIMTDVQNRIENLDSTMKDKLCGLFGSLPFFYETVYLVVQNGHLLESKNDPEKEKKQQTIDYYKRRIESKLDELGLDGKEWVADIASDYFEDFVHYRQIPLAIPQGVFFDNLKKVL